MQTPLSVIIPTYNQSKLLPETVDSILSQSYPPAEVVIVDDGSTDDTAEVVRRMPAKVKYHHKVNGGITAARNAGVALATSPYIAFCDHDDLWREDKLAQQMELHDRVPGLRYSFTNFAIVMDGVWSERTKLDEAPPEFFDSSFESFGSNFICRSSLYNKLLQFQPIFPSTTVLQTALYKSLGGADERFGRNPAEDIDFTLRCVHQPPVGIVMEPVVGIRKHAGNYSREASRNALGVIEIMKHALEHHQVEAPERDAIREKLIRCRIEASYDLFERGDFARCRELLAEVPRRRLSPKLKLKRLISGLPAPLAEVLRSSLAPGRSSDSST